MGFLMTRYLPPVETDYAQRTAQSRNAGIYGRSLVVIIIYVSSLRLLRYDVPQAVFADI
jgi:hypothetical protein